MKVVCISDTHENHRDMRIPDGDLLIHAGDITNRGSLKSLKDFADWWTALPHKHKVFICGNHDLCFEHHRPAERARALEIVKDLNYLEESGIEVEGLKIWGSPWTPWFHDWAFNAKRGDECMERWAKIPDGTNILITHGPPFGFGDRVRYPAGDRAGCFDLMEKVKKVRPLLHVFGHIHEDYGTWGHEWETLPDGRVDGTWFINAASCNLRYHAVNPPVEMQVGKTD